MYAAGKDKAYQQLAREAYGRWVGPFPIIDFLELLPSPESNPVPLENVFKNVPANSLEREMYPNLIKAFESLGLENLRFIDTSICSDLEAPYHRKWMPNISTYPSDVELEDSYDPTRIGQLKNKMVSPMRMSELLLPFELTRGKHDPFCDRPYKPGGDFESVEHLEAQGQILVILSEMLSYSFPTHAFLVFMDSYIARLFRADRSGILVSEAFDYRAHPKYLTEFLHRFNGTTSAHRGIDTTFKRELQVIQVPASNFSPDQITVKPEGKLPHTESLMSRGRRDVRVVDVSSGVSRSMKDGWRANLLVPHIPRIVAGGDVPGMYHRTLADTFVDSYWRVGHKTKLTPRVHYRFIEEDAGKRLEDFTDARELTQALADVIEALRAAWERCRYLHRNIGSINIAVGRGSEGTLMDWEFARRVPEGEDSQRFSRVDDRTGTWPYISYALLKRPERSPSPLDDLQSVYWVAFENALNYLNHDRENLSRAAQCFTEYDPMTQEDGCYKLSQLLDRRPVEFLGNPAFSKLMRDFCDIMDITTSWKKIPIAPMPLSVDGAGPLDHNHILRIFRVALDSPGSQWASEERHHIPLLWDMARRLGPGELVRYSWRPYPGMYSENDEFRRSIRIRINTTMALNFG